MALMIKNVFECFILALLMVLRFRCVVLSIFYAVADEKPSEKFHLDYVSDARSQEGCRPSPGKSVEHIEVEL